MCGGGSKTTNTTNTGLGDDQFENLAAGQETIRADVGTFGAAAEERYNETVGTLGDMSTANAEGFANVDSGITGLGTDMATGFADVATGQADLATSVDNRLTQTDENLATGFDNVNLGLENAEDGITRVVDQRGDELADQMSTGFTSTNENLATGFTGLSDQMDSNDAVLLDATNTGFTDTNTNIDEVGTAIGDQLTTTSSNVLTGQEAISKLIEKYGGDAATYYQDLAKGQTDIKEGQGTMQTAFDSYLTDFGDYTTLANQTRTDLGNSIVGGFETVGQDMTSQATATSDGFSSVGDAVSGVGDQVADVTSDVGDAATDAEQNFGDIASSISGVGEDVGSVGDAVGSAATDAETNFGSIATEIATGFNDQSTESVARKKTFVDTLTSVQDILQADTGALDKQVKDNYQNVVDAFDTQGNLITETVTAEGGTITRALSDQGELFLAEFDANGVRMGQQTLDLNSLLNNVSTFETNVNDQFTGIFGDSQVAAESRQSILDTFAVTNDLIGAVGTDVSAELTSSFDSLQSAFDDQGNLIRSEITESGSEIQRDLDAQGNLITTEISSSGEVLSQNALNISDISTQLNGVQAGLGDSITTAFDGIQNSSDELRANLIGNLDGLRNLMTTQGESLGADLKEKFTSLSDSFDENGDLIRTAVDANGDFIFRELNANGELVISTIDDATGQLIEANKFNADLLTTDFDSRFSSTEEFLRAIDSSISQVGGDIDAGLLGMASGLEEGFMTRFDELSDQEREGRTEFTNRLIQVRALLEEDVANLDDGLRGRMSELSSAFDGEGRLIANAIDDNGNMLKRSINDSGNLVLSTYSRMNGSLLDQQQLDINRLMKQVADRRVTQGSNANMGGQSPTAGAPAPASVYSGFASPYAQTY